MDIENLIAQLSSDEDKYRPLTEDGNHNRDLAEDLATLKLPKIRVLGVGGAGNNFVTALFNGIHSSRIVEIIAMNTDASQLAISKSHRRILIGKTITHGYGAGNDPVLGRKAFEESKDKIEELISDSDLLIIVAGLGGGTGSGVAPALVELAHDLGLLTMTFVTMPFKCEGHIRIKNALRALSEILQVPTVTVVIPNERLIRVAPRQTIHGAFSLANNLLVQLVQSLSDLIEKAGLINVDFADVRKVLSYKGLAIPGVATSDDTNEKRAVEVAEKILNNPILEVNPALGKAALIEIVAGDDLMLSEAYDVVNKFTMTMGEDKEIIFGLRIEPEYKSRIRVVSLITGIDIPDSNYDSIENFLTNSLITETAPLADAADVDSSV